MAQSHRRGLYLILITVHGLVRGRDMELGKDADTGGQIKYVLELARALAAQDGVDRVDVLTRQVLDGKVAPDYAEPFEELAPGARIVRLPCGPRRYLRKEVLWPYLDSFADQALKHIRRVGRIPDVIHAHYADAGYVGRRLCSLLEVPLIFTGHSMGRVKLQRLKANGMSDENIERQYHITERIEAEERALDLAELVITSTKQEVEEQYGLYDNNQPQRMVVMPPGVDLKRFYPPRRGRFKPAIYEEISRFLHNPERPMILALSRADPRKNIAALIHAYAETPGLRDKANLVIIAGNRDDIRKMEKGPRQVLTELIMLMDRYDLYGHVAIPKQHEAQDVPYLYRIAAKSGGVFVNPALTEPFGLTLLEAAASGLPVVATEDGGPRDILNYFNNGYLIDPLDAKRMGEVILD
ncbi:MAG: glycosyltransferase, partial [Gammaproteobacteria bacterium]|nr:glycosyltransferase [Gammaproteobacteria bacterium]